MSRLTVPLPKREEKMFDQLSRCYDEREFTKCISIADNILSVVPGHGETMAMKGLAIHAIEGKEKEGIEEVRKGVAANTKSALTWQCLALCHKVDKNFAQASKCYKVAADNDKSMSILRDWSSVLVQIQDWKTFLDVRQRMLSLKGNLRANWLAVASAHKMNGNLDLASAILDIMIQVMDAGDNDMERSEVHLFRAEIEMLAKRPQKTIQILRTHDAEVKDYIEKNVLRANAFEAQNLPEKAEKLWMDLAAKGFEEADAILRVAKIRGIPMDDHTRLPVHHYKAGNNQDIAKYCAKFVELCDHVAKDINPKSDCAKRFPLDCVPVADFEERLRQYIKPFVLRMIPSVTSILKSLYLYYTADDERIVTIGKVFHTWEKELEGGDYSSFLDSPSKAPNPALLLWVYQFLASHYLRLKDYTKAHEYVDRAIDHTPTIEMLYLLKAKIHSREGYSAEAAKFADTARVLDLQDKYLNSKTAKYMMRNGNIEGAEGTMQLFMKESTQNDTYLTAIESQTVWYEREVGDAFFKHKDDVISALQNYLMFERHHNDNHEELVDFHAYSFRRSSIRQWHAVQDMLANIAKQRFYCLVAPKLARAYMTIASRGEEEVRSKHTPRPVPTMSDTTEKNVIEDDKRRIKLYELYYLKDVDLSEPLVKARRYVNDLLEHRPHLADTHALALDYYFMLPELPATLALRALLSLHRLADSTRCSLPKISISVTECEAAQAALAPRLEKFRSLWASSKDEKDPRVVKAIEAKLVEL